ncbi:MAG: hypothetical protein ABEJ99_00285 [Candidatus Nanohaloarchaea archaeon]
MKDNITAAGIDLLLSIFSIYLYVSLATGVWGFLSDVTGNPLWFIADVIRMTLPLSVLAYFAFGEFYMSGTAGKNVTGVESYGVRRAVRKALRIATDGSLSKKAFLPQ